MTTSVLDSRELRSLALFSRCQPADLAAVAAAVTQTVTLPEGTVICREGETASQWWIVAEGLADVTASPGTRHEFCRCGRGCHCTSRNR